MCLYPHYNGQIVNQDQLHAVRAFAVRVERHKTDYGQKHHLFLEPLEKHSSELGDKYELGDIFLTNAHFCGGKFMKDDELLLEGRLVAARDNVDLVWQRMLSFIRGQEFKICSVPSWNGLKHLMNAVSVDEMSYFSSFKHKLNGVLSPCVAPMQIYFTGMDEGSALPTFFRQ
ncbi:hypothetical protein KY309_03835 [Candidatus Woesearchaeota archaeon]|nr:hypothetical protein [Candidatus Woesearchaeota archaeon]MBW3016713.1 hypothetical protein [Candidatus Woesearchaeota archaeon]